MLPVFFSLKNMRPSGASLSEVGKLRPVRTGVGELDEAFDSENNEDASTIMIRATGFDHIFQLQLCPVSRSPLRFLE